MGDLHTVTKDMKEASGSGGDETLVELANRLGGQILLCGEVIALLENDVNTLPVDTLAHEDVRCSLRAEIAARKKLIEIRADILTVAESDEVAVRRRWVWNRRFDDLRDTLASALLAAALAVNDAAGTVTGELRANLDVASVALDEADRIVVEMNDDAYLCEFGVR